MKIQEIKLPFINIFPYLIVNLSKEDFAFTHKTNEFFFKDINKPNYGFISHKNTTFYMELSTEAREQLESLENKEVSEFLLGLMDELLPKKKYITTDYQSKAKLESSLKNKEKEFNVLHDQKVSKKEDIINRKLLENFQGEIEHCIRKKLNEVCFLSNFEKVFSRKTVEELLENTPTDSEYHKVVGKLHEEYMELDKQLVELKKKYVEKRDEMMDAHNKIALETMDGWEDLPKDYKNKIDSNLGSGVITL